MVTHESEKATTNEEVTELLVLTSICGTLASGKAHQGFARQPINFV